MNNKSWVTILLGITTVGLFSTNIFKQSSNAQTTGNYSEDENSTATYSKDKINIQKLKQL